MDSETAAVGAAGVKTSHWYALGVGVVKGAVTVGNRDAAYESKQFTPGK